jgi:hypothetical protein
MKRGVLIIVEVEVSKGVIVVRGGKEKKKKIVVRENVETNCM